jgi:hypothetical protein
MSGDTSIGQPRIKEGASTVVIIAIGELTCNRAAR